MPNEKEIQAQKQIQSQQKETLKLTETSYEPKHCQTSKMEHFAKIVNGSKAPGGTNDVHLVSLVLTMNLFDIFFLCSFC